MSAPDWRLAVDIGGTFTDVVLLDRASGRVVVDKVLTTPKAPLDGVRAGVLSLLKRADVSPTEITAPIVHATTLVTNALIEGKTARAALVTTTGFGDTLEIRTATTCTTSRSSSRRLRCRGSWSSSSTSGRSPAASCATCRPPTPSKRSPPGWKRWA